MRMKWVQDPRVVDAAAVLGCLFLTVLAVKASWSVLPRPVIAVAGAIGSLEQWRRRQRPGAAALAGSAAYLLSGNPGPWLVGVYSGASYGRRRWVWLVGLIGWAGFAGASLLGGGLSVSDIAWSAVATGFVVAVGMYMAARRALLASWRDQADRAVAERHLRDERARAAERTRIAREMHDVLAHKVSLIAVHAGALELTADGAARESAGLIRVTAREALQELRYVLGVLRESTSEGPAGDVGDLVRAATDAGQRVELHDEIGPLPTPTARVVHRVVQEGLTNARKHAPGAAVTVTVHRGQTRTAASEDLTVRVTVDNGPPAAAVLDLPGSGSGLVGLAERVHLVGGILHSGPTSDGWRLAADVPWLDTPPADPKTGRDADPPADRNADPTADRESVR
jgi:signal transduction histidine kinase